MADVDAAAAPAARTKSPTKAAASGAAAATREDVVHLEVRLNALQKLVASIDSTATWDAEMVAKVDEALSAFGGGLDPAVNAAVARIRARVDERAALVAERVAE